MKIRRFPLIALSPVVAVRLAAQPTAPSVSDHQPVPPVAPSGHGTGVFVSLFNDADLASLIN